MKKFDKWCESKNSETNFNKDGGIEPSSKEINKFRKVDLITLPPDIQGTNCGNCSFFDAKEQYCSHKEVQTHVSERMCCKEWDNKKVERAWK